MYKNFYTFNGKNLELKQKLSESEEEVDIYVTSLKVPHPEEIIESLDDSPLNYVSPIFAEREKKVLTNGFDVIKDISYISTDDITEIPYFKIFKDYSDEMKNALQESIKANGLFSPIILWKHFKEEKYHVISGYERLNSYKALYSDGMMKSDEVAMEKYKCIPAFILNFEDITIVNAKQIYIEANICSRTIDGETRVKAYSQYYMILKYLKERRNEYNIIDEMKDKFRVSKQTIYNYLNLSKLIDPLMYLFQEKVISFKSALKLSKFKKEYQEKILETVGLQNINNAKISVIRTDSKSMKEFLINLKTVVDFKFPYWSVIKIKLPTKFIEEFAPEIQKLVKLNPKYFLKAIFPKIAL